MRIKPIHVHINKGDANGKIWLVPEVSTEYLIGFTKSEEKDILEIIETNSELFKKKWNEYFGQ